MNIFRKAVKDVTLSDGTRIPKGTLVAAASVTAHTDDTRYAEPDVFDPFRFARMREGGVEDAVKHQLVNTSVDFLPFGHGKHAWSVLLLVSPTYAMLHDTRLTHTSARPQPRAVLRGERDQDDDGAPAAQLRHEVRGGGQAAGEHPLRACEPAVDEREGAVQEAEAGCGDE